GWKRCSTSPTPASRSSPPTPTTRSSSSTDSVTDTARRAGRDTDVVPRLLDLDDPRCADPRLAGGKAATLARARQSGLPVLPGVVVTVEESTEHVRGGVDALARRGSGGARLEVTATPLDE